MTLTGTFSGNFAESSGASDESSNWSALYCSHLWSNSNLRRAFIDAPCKDNKSIKYCYTCRGKIRNYGISTPKNNFLPNNHSTPKPPCEDTLQMRLHTQTSESEICLEDVNYPNNCSTRKTSVNDITLTNAELAQYIPTISRQIDASIRRKYTSNEYNTHDTNRNQRRLTKSLKGIGCVVNFSLTESPKKRRTQIQACSISVMIIAIVSISLVLVNFTTPNFTHKMLNETSTNLVPTENIDINETSSAIVSVYTDPLVSEITETAMPDSTTTENIMTTTKTSSITNIISKIRKNIKTYPKNEKISQESKKPKDIINRDLSQRFCSCQINEVCMLDELSGTSICKVALDMDDPTGCGGLCAMETEACQLVDKLLGVRVCRALMQVSCTTEDWRCRNGFCVPLEARCDGSIQCYDRSDEMHCECDLTKQFRCGHSISCFSNNKLCDGFIDCWDGFDETNCTQECPEDQFPCNDGQCIMSSRFCDGLADCSDGSDEPQGCDGDCGAHEMQCKNKRCVARSHLCDGRDDCGDNSDELNCS